MQIDIPVKRTLKSSDCILFHWQQYIQLCMGPEPDRKQLRNKNNKSNKHNKNNKKQQKQQKQNKNKKKKKRYGCAKTETVRQVDRWSGRWPGR